jgi:hypothetical protein
MQLVLCGVVPAYLAAQVSLRRGRLTS